MNSDMQDVYLEKQLTTVIAGGERRAFGEVVRERRLDG